MQQLAGMPGRCTPLRATERAQGDMHEHGVVFMHSYRPERLDELLETVAPFRCCALCRFKYVHTCESSSAP